MLRAPNHCQAKNCAWMVFRVRSPYLNGFCKPSGGILHFASSKHRRNLTNQTVLVDIQVAIQAVGLKHKLCRLTVAAGQHAKLYALISRFGLISQHPCDSRCKFLVLLGFAMKVQNQHQVFRAPKNTKYIYNLWPKFLVRRKKLI